MSKSYIRTYQDGTEYLEHRNGIEWGDAPPPMRWHRCQPQTRGFLWGESVERCACGGVRLNGFVNWIERNSRRRRRKGWTP